MQSLKPYIYPGSLSPCPKKLKQDLFIRPSSLLTRALRMSSCLQFGVTCMQTGLNQPQECLLFISSYPFAWFIEHVIPQRIKGSEPKPEGFRVWTPTHLNPSPPKKPPSHKAFSCSSAEAFYGRPLSRCGRGLESSDVGWGGHYSCLPADISLRNILIL